MQWLKRSVVGENNAPVPPALVRSPSDAGAESLQLGVRQHPVSMLIRSAVRGKQPFIVLHTSLIELCWRQKKFRQYCSSELGSPKCDHGVYLTLVNLLVLGQWPAPGLDGCPNVASTTFRVGYAAEFTCDRACTVGNPFPKCGCPIDKTSLRSPTLAAHPNHPDAFFAQLAPMTTH